MLRSGVAMNSIQFEIES